MAQQIIDSYYASYSLEYYEVGKVYSFYAKKGINQNRVTAIPANEETVKQYSRAFRDIEDDTDQYSPEGAFGNLVRFYGVVVDKVPGNGDGSFDKIIVMVKQSSENEADPVYGLKAYVVNYQGIWADGREILGAKASVEPGSFMHEQGFLTDYEFSEPNGGGDDGPGHQPITKKKKDGPQHQPVTAMGGGKKGANSNGGTEQVDPVTGVVTRMKKDESDE